jgi:hypothetical protein
MPALSMTDLLRKRQSVPFRPTSDESPRMTAYDIIPDIHGDLGRLEATLESLGARHSSGAWRMPGGRKAAFLGDFIDTGTENGAVLDAVRRMIDADEAVAVMGNHDFNAWLYHTPGENSLGHPCGYARAHLPKNARQHETFLAEFPVGSVGARDALEFIATLPVCLDLGGLKLAHAAWSESRVAAILARRPDGRLDEEDLQPLALEDWDDPFVEAVLTILKGPEAPLPRGRSFTDHKGDVRHNIRLRWWQTDAQTWRDVAASVPDPSELPEGPFDSALVPTIDPGSVPVAFGHYKRRGAVEIEAPCAFCLDYPDTPLAYRWDGEPTFLAEKIVFS